MEMMNNVSDEKDSLSIRLFANKYLIYGLVLIMLVTPLFLTSNLKFEDVYFFDRTSSILGSENDQLSFSGREFSYASGGIYVTYFLKNIISKDLVYSYLPIILGLISLLLARDIFSKLEKNKRINIIFTYLLIFSTPFIYTFTNYVNESFTLFLLLLGIFFYLRSYKSVSVVVLWFMSFFGFFPGLVALLTMGLLSYKDKIKYLYYFLTLQIIYYFYSIFSRGFPSILNIRGEILSNYLLDFGSAYGISFFLIIVAIFGLRTIWKQKYTYYKLYLALISLLVLSYFDSHLMIFLNLILVVLAAYGFNSFIKMKWEGKQIKVLTILILAIGILVSTFTYLSSVDNFNPNESLVEGLIDINRDSVVFSHYSNGVFINTISKNKNVLDSHFSYVDNVNRIYDDANKIFVSRRVGDVEELLVKYDIDYILITQWMKDNIWVSDEDGLLFVLKHSQNINLEFSGDGVDIWRFKK
jgi:hypothetical protein